MLSLKAIRTKKGLTINELAEKSGITRATISALENGRNSCLISTILNLAKALDVTADELLADSAD